MLYGIILESVRDGILLFYGDRVWKCIVSELKLPSETFDLFERYDHKIIFNICECMAQILSDGTPESYLEFFGQDFVRYLMTFGFEKLLRVGGRTFRDFLFAIDQLHDSKRFAFPQMYQPLFHVTEENETGAALLYKSVRHGFARYAIGGILAVAKTLFEEQIKMDVRQDSSTKEHANIVFWVQFDNKEFQQKQLFNFPTLPTVNGTTFFRVFPFSILMDSTLRIHRMGSSIKHLFPPDTPLLGRPLDEVFRLIRPDIPIEWDKLLSYGRHIVFLMENCLPLRTGSSGVIRLKGQMKYIENKNMLWFLCHPVLESADDVIGAGLYLTDLNLFDNTSDILITGMQQERAIEEASTKQNIWLTKLQESKHELKQWRKKSHVLLYSMLPKHIAALFQSGIQPNCICESHPLVTILFAYLLDFKALSVHHDPVHIIECLNQIIEAFDKIDENYDVFKVETKADASYMVVAGLSDRLHMTSYKAETVMGPSMYDNDNEEEEENMDEEVDKNPSGLNQSEIVASLALDLLNVCQNIVNPITNAPFKVKIGFHSGPAVGGVLGRKNIQYCLFGDTVNMASRVTTTSVVGRVQLSHSSYSYLSQENRFTTEYRGQIEMKDIGTRFTYWLTGRARKASINVINKTPTQLKCPFTGEMHEI